MSHITEPLILLLDGDAWSDPTLTGLRLMRRANAPAELTLRLEGGAQAPAIGAGLVVMAGPRCLFRGRIHERRRERDAQGQRIDLSARDTLFELSRLRTDGVETATSVHATLGRLAARVGLTLETSGRDLRAGRLLHRAVDDLGFLYQVLARYGLAVACRDQALHLYRPDDQSAPAANVSAHVTRLRDCERAPATARGLTGWTMGRDLGLRAGDRETGWAGLPLSGEEDPADVLAGQPLPASRSMSADLEGLHDLWPGERAQVAPDEAAYLLGRIELLADAAGGQRTLLTSHDPDRDRPPAPDAAPHSAFHLAEVHRVDDPMRAGRVRVALHGYGGALTGWIPTLSAGGADGSGLSVSLSEGDPVLLATPEGDPERGVVLGVVSRRAPRQLSGETRTGLGLATEAMALTMADDSQTLSLTNGDSGLILRETGSDAGMTLELSDGTRIALSPGKIHLTARDRLELDSAGQVVIRGRRIDFEEA